MAPDVIAQTFRAYGRELYIGGGSYSSRQTGGALWRTGLTLGVAALLVGRAGGDVFADSLVGTSFRPQRDSRLLGAHGARLREYATALKQNSPSPAPTAPAPGGPAPSQGRARATPISELGYVSTDVQPIEVHGCPAQYYQLDVQVGEQTTRLTADTGSCLLLTSSLACDNCATPQYYQPGSTSTDTGENYTAAYGTGSEYAPAEIYLDTVGIAPLR